MGFETFFLIRKSKYDMLRLLIFSLFNMKKQRCADKKKRKNPNNPSTGVKLPKLKKDRKWGR